ncbi:MAG: hypothetical protein H6568_07055 [Lewinellaceae bacterium]|nr:hypothetical protein [Lewinellaceae bacterium]
MKYIAIIFMLMFQVLSAQNSPESFWKNKCEFTTDGSGKSLGLKIRVPVPCAWEQSEGKRPHVVKTFSYGFPDGSSISQSLTVNKLPNSFSKSEINELFSQDGLRSMCEGTGTFVSGRRVRIDGLECAEVIARASRNSPVATFYAYMLSYYLIYKDKIVVIGYMTGSISDEDSKELFDTYKEIFQGLATGTIIMTQWE